MYLFSSDTFTTDGITVARDHADKNTFWYLPGPVGLAKLPGSDQPQFLLTEFAEDVAANGVGGVGFLNVTLSLVPGDMTLSKIMGQIRTQFPDADNPNLVAVSFDEGTVQIVTLDMQGSGGTSAAPAPPGTFQAVENILGATSPDLFGANEALFGLKLSQAGATILEQAFEDGMAPVGVIYNMKFTGVLPSLDVKVTADMKRVYDSFSIGLEAKAYWVSAGIEATFEKLRQEGSIKVEVVDLSTSASMAEKENWALNLFKDQIMSQWFAPSLSPTTAQQASVTMPPPSPVTPPVASTTRPPVAVTTRPPAVVTTKPPVLTTSPPVVTTKPPVVTTQAPATGATVTAPPSGAGLTAPGATTPAPMTTRPPVTTPPPGTPTAPLANAANALANAAGTASGASSAASPFGISLQLKIVHQDELKTVTIEYNRMDAAQRTYAPQGYFGLALQGLDKSKLFLKVDGSDVFFNKFVVTGNAPKDFATIGLLTAHVAMDYGDLAGSEPTKHGEFLFDPSNPATNPSTQTWPIFEGLIQDTSYTYTADYKFDPDSGWQGEQTAYTLPTVKTDNRLLNLDPHDFLGFLAVSVSPGRMDANLVDRIDVMLQYTAKSGWQTSTTITVKPDSKPQIWKLRLTDKTDSIYTYSTTCYLKDGTTFNSGPFTSSATAILVSDPFARALDLLVQPAFDPMAFKLGIVEVSYADDANHYGFQTSLEVLGTSAIPAKVHIPLVNNTLKQYQYRVTLLSTANKETQGNYITSSDPLILVTL